MELGRVSVKHQESKVERLNQGPHRTAPTPSFEQISSRSLRRKSVSAPQEMEPSTKKHKVGQLRLRNGQFGGKAIARKTSISKKGPQEELGAKRNVRDNMDRSSIAQEKDFPPVPKRLEESEKPRQDTRVLPTSIEEQTEYLAPQSTVEERSSHSQNEIWDCPLDGCFFQLQDAHLDENVQRIQDHISKHTCHDPSNAGKLSTVYIESRSHLPVRSVSLLT